jgi:hypothetical protein
VSIAFKIEKAYDGNSPKISYYETLKYEKSMKLYPKIVLCGV